MRGKATNRGMPNLGKKKRDLAEDERTPEKRLHWSGPDHRSEQGLRLRQEAEQVVLK